MTGPVRILFIGDLVGSAGRHAVLALLPAIIEAERPHFTVVNGENAAGGSGITPQIAEELHAAGVDAITLGNHAYRRSEIWPVLEDDPRIIRPANHFASSPGRGTTVIAKDGVRLGILNLSGNHGMKAAQPFIATADAAVEDLDRRSDLILVDMHAEATSEKIALGWHLDGRVTAVVGTHTHVPTADARILPGGTAYITDVGMTGSRDGVIGVRRELALKAMTSQLPVRFEPADADPWLNGVLIESAGADAPASIRQLLLRAPDR